MCDIARQPLRNRVTRLYAFLFLYRYGIVRLLTPVSKRNWNTFSMQLTLPKYPYIFQMEKKIVYLFILVIALLGGKYLVCNKTIFSRYDLFINKSFSFKIKNTTNLCAITIEILDWPTIHV